MKPNLRRQKTNPTFYLFYRGNGGKGFKLKTFKNILLQFGLLISRFNESLGSKAALSFNKLSSFAELADVYLYAGHVLHIPLKKF